MMNPVIVLESTFLPLLQELRDQITLEFPQYPSQVWSSSIGGKTEFQGHTTGLECMFPDAANHEANCVTISIGVMHLTTAPMLYEASVEWGSGDHPDVSIELVEHQVPFSTASLQNVVLEFHNLAATLRQALQSWPHRTRA